MSADSFHHLVEKMNSSKMCYFEDFTQVINYGGNALQMTFSDIVKIHVVRQAENGHRMYPVWEIYPLLSF